MFKLKIEKEITVTQEDIDDIMCTALEGGILYWCRRAEVVGEYLGEYGHEQISRGGMLKLHDREEDEVYELTLDKLLKGIKMAINDNYCADYGWFTNNSLDTGSIDADIADVIIQFALFDEVMFA